MEPVRDFRSIINSVPFTFLVGPNHTKLTIQSGLARHVSKPLDHLINSGKTRESKHQIAILEDEDVETFVAFCEFAYTGDYAVPPPGFREKDIEQVSINHALNGVYPDTGRTSPAASLERSPRKPKVPSEEHPSSPDEDNDRVRGVDGDREPRRDPSQESSFKDRQVCHSTKSEYTAQNPAATPRDSDHSPAPLAEVSPTRGRRRRRGKNDEQGVIQDATSKLTPPCTPPGAARVEAVTHSTAEPSEEFPGLTGAEQPTSQSTEHPARTFSNGANESGYGGNKHRQEESMTRSRARPVIDTSFANQEFSPRHEKGTTSLWEEFTGIDDSGFRPSSSRARSSNPPAGVALPYLIFHAKLYVFATRYLIPGLAHLCLQKLHYDLLNLAFPDPDPENQYEEQLVLTTTKARMIVDLLNYTYTKTTRLEPITPSSATQLRDNELRRLVVHYAACKVRDLAVYCPPVEPIAGSPFYPEQPSARGFRALLDTLPELASDLIYRMI
ncbi:hypothetical protein BDW72DRAFT_60331 [Aspergillus terricola var. indicus]